MPLSATRPSAFHEQKHLVAPHDSLLRTPAFAGLAPGEPVGTSGGRGEGWVCKRFHLWRKNVQKETPHAGSKLNPLRPMH